MPKILDLPPSKRLGRADLLRGLILLGEDNLDTIAELSGFQPPDRDLELIFPGIPVGVEKDNEKKDRDKKVKPLPKPPSPIHYYRLIKRQPSELLPAPSRVGTVLPDWYQDIPQLDLDSVHPQAIEPPIKESLVPWPKLWPVLHALLSQLKRSRQPDIPRLVGMMAHAKIPERIPRKTRQQWSAAVHVLVDRPERTRLFNDDYNQLLKQLERLRGSTGLDVQQLLQKPGGAVRILQGKHYRNQPWHLPPAGSTVLIMSDLGLLDTNSRAVQEWLRFGERLRIAGFRPTVLLPLPRRYLTHELIHVFDCVCWSRHSDLRPVSWTMPKKSTGLSALEQDWQGDALDLLAWLSPAVRVEPGLLRAACHRLASAQNDAGVEVAAWLHDDVQATPIGFYYRPENLNKHRNRFKKLATANPVLASHMADLIRRYHSHVFPTQIHEEMLILADLLGETWVTNHQTDIDNASTHWRQLLQAVNEKKSGSEGLPAFAYYALSRQHPTMWQNPLCQHLPALWGVLQRDYPQQALTVLPDFITDSSETLRIALAFLDQQSGLVLDYVLFQRGMKALQASTRKRFQEGEDGFSVGSTLAEFQVASNYALQQRQHDGKLESRLLPLNDYEFVEFGLEENEQQQLHIAGEKLTIERFRKPDWVESIGRSQDALTVTTRSTDKTYTWYWHPPEIGVDWGMRVDSNIGVEHRETYDLPGFWHYLPPNAKEGLTPDWAESAARDRYGLYADANIAGITQRFRWIQPGSFDMGSLQLRGKNGGFYDETQHRVILTKGYWLADTLCTQALWQAVTGKNPSRFEGEEKPVENVSWDDINGFLQQLNRQQFGLLLRLPSEAEWEYACRANTDTAFHVGNKLTLADANYRGTWNDWGSWAEGALQQTSMVKSYAANHWGLYDMHGNVWEWCQDWMGEYPKMLVKDPLGLHTGSVRVVRGGSWFTDARSCHSTTRHGDLPAKRHDHCGFRFARDS